MKGRLNIVSHYDSVAWTRRVWRSVHKRSLRPPTCNLATRSVVSSFLMRRTHVHRRAAKVPLPKIALVSLGLIPCLDN